MKQNIINMSEYTITFVIALISLLVIMFLLFVLYITIAISRTLKIEQERALNEINDLKKELRFQKTVSKTFQDGLEALNVKK